MVTLLNTLNKSFGIAKKKAKTKYKKIKKEYKKREAANSRKRDIVNSMTNTELMKVVKSYISSKPRIKYTDPKGKIKERMPNRNEMIDGIYRKVSIENIFDSIPRIKKKFS